MTKKDIAVHINITYSSVISRYKKLKVINFTKSQIKKLSYWDIFS